jgi:hypothetical protein
MYRIPKDKCYKSTEFGSCQENKDRKEEYQITKEKR